MSKPALQSSPPAAPKTRATDRAGDVRLPAASASRHPQPDPCQQRPARRPEAQLAPPYGTVAAPALQLALAARARAGHASGAGAAAARGGAASRARARATRVATADAPGGRSRLATRACG